MGDRRRNQMRIRNGKSAGTRRTVGRGKTEEKRGGLGRFVLCCTVFILMVAGKLLLPERMESINERLKAAMHQNIDVQEVFSAVGRSLSGQGAGGDLYKAVFGGEAAVPVQRPVQLEVQEDPGQALELFHGLQEASEADGEAEPAWANVPYTEETVPENVCMGQKILGFSTCKPVEGTLTSGFGYRIHPKAGEERFHYGVDLGAEEGTPVVCFADGVVKAVGESSSYGKYCMVEHAGGFETLYGHCSSISVSAGTELQAGDAIGKVGHTGMAVGNHLHFELQQDGTYLNPEYYLAG